jgi:hypothetical protein
MGPWPGKWAARRPAGATPTTGPVAIQWHKTRTAGAPDDAAELLRFARSLAPGSLLRHHVAGDLGRE